MSPVEIKLELSECLQINTVILQMKARMDDNVYNLTILQKSLSQRWWFYGSSLISDGLNIQKTYKSKETDGLG